MDLQVKLANAILKKRLQDIMYLQETFDNLLQELQAAKSEVTKERGESTSQLSNI